jgi:cathepsin B
MVSCDKSNLGCQGGYLNRAWLFIQNTGVVTDNCYPYTSGNGVDGACKATCSNGDPFTKHKCKPNTAMSFSGVAAIKAEIFANGPVETGFTVYSDFMSYKGGIYQHVSGQQEGGHAVKIIGWGVDSVTGKTYWIVANSWNTTWGEKGFFNIFTG